MSHSSLNKKQSAGPLERTGYLLAAGLGAGFAPIAPGTVGSLEGVAIFLAIVAFHPGLSTLLAVLAVVNGVLFAVGVWASNCACRITGLEDPRLAVIDEVSGQLITLTPLVFWAPLSIPAVVAGFLLFRLFDIFKPYPIRKLERLHGGLGVMADDTLAGVYAAAVLCLGHIMRLL